MAHRDLKHKLENLYQSYNRREFVDPDPLLFLYDYPDIREREIVAVIASAFAYGKVELIMKNVGGTLERLGPSPFEYLASQSEKDMNHDFKGFVYRFAKTPHLVGLLVSLKGILEQFGSIETCIKEGMQAGEDDIISGLSYLYRMMEKSEQMEHLMADPDKNSACKRSHLMMRWMVRKDEVDPGGWDHISLSSLMIPLDTHMYRVGRMLGFTQRKSMDGRTALEITRGFRKISPEDPVRYDFCLTRFGIRRDMDMTELEAEISQ